ncbi:MAG: hypothetical protein WBQ11_24060, partial [Isosphaeraceae bacterium]
EPGRPGRRYYGRSNLARLSEGFGGATQVESAGYVVAALCGLGRTENRPDKITLNPDLLVPLRRAGWTRRGRILDEHHRLRSGSSGVAGGPGLAPAGMSLARRSRR